MIDLKSVNWKNYDNVLKSLTVTLPVRTREYKVASGILRSRASQRSLRARLNREAEPEHHRDEYWWINRDYRRKPKLTKPLKWYIKNFIKSLIV